MVTWDVLLPTIPHRHEQMCGLLAEFDRQWQPGLGMLVYRDNMDRPGLASYGKWNDLQEASRADYVSFIADDDFIAPNFVSCIMEALEQRPDYVGFKVRYTCDGEPRCPVEHSLVHGRWNMVGNVQWDGKLVRDIVHQNPIRRELALLGHWRTDHQSGDYLWAEELRNSGQVKDEVWVPEELFYYQESSTGSWTNWGGVNPGPLPEKEILPLPAYPWLTSLGI